MHIKKCKVFSLEMLSALAQSLLIKGALPFFFLASFVFSK